ncbi:hypothetical protein DFS34DRAFT_605638 [Phlyctochytrium arcticum]|nr:hypothetical protein DFS34DRAFT_605638 [Phlyctochytrium arcticum]
MPFAHDMGRGGDGIGDDDDWGGPSGTTPADKLHFTNLVLENDDDIMVEARALLEDWTSNPHPPRAMDDASSPIKIASGLSDYQSLEEKMEAAQERESLKALLGLPHTDTFMSSSSKSKHPSVFPPPPPSSSSSLSRIGNINKTQDRHLLAQTRREMSHRSKSQHLERQLEQKQQRMIISLQARREQVQISGAGGTRHEPSRKLDVAIRAARLALAQDAVTVMASPRTSGVGSHRIGQSKSTKQMQDQVINDAYRQLTQNPTSNVLPASHLIWKNNVPVKIDHKVLDPPFNKQALSEDEGDGEQDLSEHDGERDERRTLQMIKVEEMANVKRLKNLKKPFSGWRALIIKTEGVVERFQVISTWRDQSRVFAKWLSRTRRAISHRETLALAAEHQRQQEALVRAIRYARGMALSKAFMGWTRWVRGEKEARRVKEMHEERKRRMEEALKRREEAAAAAEMERFERESVKAAAVQINAQGPAPCQVTQPMPASETSTVTSPLAPPAPNKPDSPPTTNEVTDITHPAPIPAGATTTSHELHEPTSKCGPSQSKPRRPIRTQRDMELIHQMEQRDAGRRNRRLALEQKKQERLEAIEAKKCAAVQAQLEAEEAAKNLLLAQKRAAAEALAAKQAHQKRVKQIVEGQCGRRHLRLVLKVFRTWIDSVRVMEVQADEWRLRKMWLGWKHVFDMRRSDREEQADRIWRNKSLATSLRDWKAVSITPNRPLEVS